MNFLKGLWSPKTLSFWSGVTALGLLFSKKKPAKFISAVACMLVGFGGIGCAYGRYATEQNLPIEPIPIFNALVHKDGNADERLEEARTHGIFALIGMWKLWRLLGEE